MSYFPAWMCALRQSTPAVAFAPPPSWSPADSSQAPAAGLVLESSPELAEDGSDKWILGTQEKTACDEGVERGRRAKRAAIPSASPLASLLAAYPASPKPSSSARPSMTYGVSMPFSSGVGPPAFPCPLAQGRNLRRSLPFTVLAASSPNSRVASGCSPQV